MPLTATIWPARSSAAAATVGSALPGAASGSAVPAAATSARRGPHAGQQTGWAWKRRSAGSRYSAAQSSHIANPAIVVSARS